MGNRLQTLDATNRRFSGGWYAEDFVSANGRPTAVRDPWIPVAIQSPLLAPAKARTPNFALDIRAADPWSPVEFSPPVFQFLHHQTDPWFDDINLPTFDPNARRSTWTLDHLDGPLARDAKSKAAWIVVILQPVTIRERADWLRAFEEVFIENEGDRFFRKVRELAGTVDRPEPLLAAVEIRNIWEDRSELRQIRVPGQYGVTFTSALKLSWNTALRLAVARCDYDPSDMIDADWIAEWRRLKWHADGYWSFADYACLRAEHERFEDWDTPASVWREEARWSAGRSTPADDISGMSVKIRDGWRTVPAIIAKRYEEWKEEQVSSLKRVAFSPSTKQSEKRVIAKETKFAIVEKQTSPAEACSFQEEFNALFGTLKSEMQSTIELARPNPSEKPGSSSNDLSGANQNVA